MKQGDQQVPESILESAIPIGGGTFIKGGLLQTIPDACIHGWSWAGLSFMSSHVVISALPAEQSQLCGSGFVPHWIPVNIPIPSSQTGPGL